MEKRSQVQTFFEKETGTAQHILWCPHTKKAAIIDPGNMIRLSYKFKGMIPVLEYDIIGGKTSLTQATLLINFLKENNLELEWILETHAHADHLSSSSYLKSIFPVGQIFQKSEIILQREQKLPLEPTSQKFRVPSKKYLVSRRYQRMALNLIACLTTTTLSM
jgi:glyoxylase-like metal-dependent hydrolase (beta-lactamase superfamily II)